MDTGGVPPGGAWSDDLGLASALADGVVVLAPDGTIAWANEAFARLLGSPLESLVGGDGFSLVHPEELARAADGAAYAARFPGRTSVAPYRVRRGDGTWLDIELKSGLVDHPQGEHLALVVRDGTSRQTLSRALRSVASGSSLSHTASLVCDAIVRRWPNTGVAVTYGDDAQLEQVVISRHLSPSLVDHARGGVDGPEAWSPWDAGAALGDIAVLEREHLPPALWKAANDEGYEGCAIARVVDPSGAPACVVAWFDHMVIAHLEFRHAAAELAEVLSLALERRHHSRELSRLARHDALTGLLNRIGCFERLEAELEATRSAGDEALAVLFLDLDGLKEVNDRDGHAAGDRLLVHAAERLYDGLGATCLLARIGGDEFVVARRFAEQVALEAAESLAEQVSRALVEDHPDQLQPVAASIGIAVDEPDASVDRLLERADAAMYRAKASEDRCWST